MSRSLVLVLACTLALGCKSEPEASPAESSAIVPTYGSLFEAGATKLAAAVEALPRPLKEFQIGQPSNRTREMLDTRQLGRELTAQLLTVEGAIVVERHDAPWLVKSTIGSEEVRGAKGVKVTTTLQIQVVDTRGGIVASVEATQVDQR